MTRRMPHSKSAKVAENKLGPIVQPNRTGSCEDPNPGLTPGGLTTIQETMPVTKHMLAFAEFCMTQLLSEEGPNGEMPEISSENIRRIHRVLDKYRSEEEREEREA